MIILYKLYNIIYILTSEPNLKIYIFNIIFILKIDIFFYIIWLYYIIHILTSELNLKNIYIFKWTLFLQTSDDQNF